MGATNSAEATERVSVGSGHTAAALVESGHAYVDRHPVCRFCVHLRTLVGTITAGVIFWAGITTLIDYHEIPISIYLLFIGVPVLLLELGAFIRICCGADGACCRFFCIVLGLDAWKRGIFYALLGAICMIPDVSSVPAKIAGGCLLVSAIFYFVKSFQKKKVKMFVLEQNQAQRQQQELGNSPAVASVTPATIYRATAPTTAAPISRD